jgi:signal transduction histidine kinase
MGFQVPMWRAIAVFRAASLLYALALVTLNSHDYSRWLWAWVVLGVMAGWTAVTTYAYRDPRRAPVWLACDLVVTAGLLLSTAAVQYPWSMRAGAMPVTATWVAGPVLAWGVRWGRRAGITAALVLAGCDFALRSERISVALNGAVLLVLAGALIGHLARLAAEAERFQQRVTEVEAASRERDRLARDIHDSVLQVLALVQRRGLEAGGEAAELGRLAGQQEAALRALIGARPVPYPAGRDGEVDLGALLGRESSTMVAVSTPAGPVLLTAAAAGEMALAVRAALDNVRRHCPEGTRAWVLVEDEGDEVAVTIRDEGPGVSDGRLAEAAAAGRLGVTHAIRGRMRDLGGTAQITSTAGQGTLVVLRVPRHSRVLQPGRASRPGTLL